MECGRRRCFQMGPSADEEEEVEEEVVEEEAREHVS